MSDPKRRAAPPPASTGEYEYRVLVFARGVSRSEARRRLTEHAEYERWELARVQVFMGGSRRVTLRRRIMRVQRSA